MRLRPLRVTLIALGAAGLLAVGLAACGTQTRAPTQSAASPRAHLPGPGRTRIAVIVMENEEFGSIVGSPSAPFINRLARTYALATQSYAISHPSLPNYLALTGGSTFGIDSDCTDCTVPGPGLATQLDRAGRSWKAYMEDLPRPCFGGSSAGAYAQKHDPFIYYRDVRASAPRCAHVVPLSALSGDEGRHALPSFTWISPNLCHDMHDCGTSTGDRFLARLVPPLLAALGPRGLLVLTWDEGSSDNGCCKLAHGGHIATILAGAGAARGARLATPVDHYSVLQTIEDLLRLPRLRGAACPCTPSLQPLLKP